MGNLDLFSRSQAAILYFYEYFLCTQYLESKYSYGHQILNIDQYYKNQGKVRNWVTLTYFQGHRRPFCKNHTKSHFSPIKTENFNFFINMSLSYFFLTNPVLLSELPYFPKWPTYGQLLKKASENA